MTLLALIRHGPTPWNAEGRIQGRADVAMGAVGEAAVRSWAIPEALAGCRWLASPLRRAFDTATAIGGKIPALDDKLIEMDWGEWEGRVLAEIRAELGEAMAAMEARGLDFRPPGGESPRDVQGRVAPLLVRLAREGEGTAAVTHKGVIRAVYARAAAWDMTGKPPHKMRDGHAHLFSLAADGAPRIAQLNVPLEAP